MSLVDQLRLKCRRPLNSNRDGVPSLHLECQTGLIGTAHAYDPHARATSHGYPTDRKAGLVGHVKFITLLGDTP
jgi:hypothetical protein